MKKHDAGGKLVGSTEVQGDGKETTVVSESDGVRTETTVKADAQNAVPEGVSAEAVLRSLATAANTFASYNQGKYPRDMKDLTQAMPPYLMVNYCDQTAGEYKITCSMGEDFFEFAAVPVEGASAQTTIKCTNTECNVPR